MDEHNSSILQNAASFVRDHYESKDSEGYSYHDFAHTESVVNAARTIGIASGISEEELEAVLLACYFHDVGVIEQYHDHESASCTIAERFMTEQNYTEANRSLVCDCIMATSLHAEPRSLPEQITSDADLIHLSKKDFCDQAQLLRQEWKTVLSKEFSDIEWMYMQHEFMKDRTYSTKFAQATYQQQLEENSAWLKKRIKKFAGEDSPYGVKKKKKKKKAESDVDAKSSRPGRGVETMFRTSARSHVDFSAMVDSKASIMITINTLVVSLIISVLLRKLDTNPWMIVPTFVFLTVCVLTIVFAVLASRPKVTSGMFTREDIRSKRANLLFFGNFYNVDVEDFEWGMKEMIKDSDYLYTSMIRDFYFLGQVLGKKYKYMRISYNIFMYGLVFAVILYLVVFFIYDPQGLPL